VSVPGATVIPNPLRQDKRGAAKKVYHVCVCICTFKRPELLRRALASIACQVTGGFLTCSVVVVDNDATQSAHPVVAEFSSNSRIPVTYCVEPRQNIALARNKAVEYADGDFIAFIDDDEFATEDWLRNLLATCLAYGVDGVLGPVRPYFEVEPPSWLRKGGFFDRETYPTGSKLAWPNTRTGNVLFGKGILTGFDMPFNPEFATAGEDMDFFRRMMEKGHEFVWCNEAIAYEVIAPSRCNRSFLLKRALLRGSNFPKHPKHRIRNIAKSLVAVPCYTLALPLLSLCGEHVFVKYLGKLLDHASRLLAFCGLPLVRERET
jgi:glycosyltransferase involved in cell wall biosynthesis